MWLRLAAVWLICAGSLLAQSGPPLRKAAVLSSGLRVFTSETASYFANNGATYPIYGTATTPSAVYESSTDTTWFAWEAWNGVKRAISVRTYNHTTSVWSAVYTIDATNTLVDDDHGVPALCRDASGYWHIFYGAHNGPMYHSSSFYVDDPSEWTTPVAMNSGSNGDTYPHPVLVGSVIYVFMRHNDGNDYSQLFMYKTTALTAGVPTWSSSTVIADFDDNDSRFYLGNCVLRSAKIHMVATHANLPDDYRRNVYYLVYNTANGQVENFAGTSNTVPILGTALESTYKIISQPTPTGSGDHPALVFDDANAPHIIYMDGSNDSTHAQKVYHTAYENSAWTTPYLLGTAYSKDSEFVITAGSGGGVDAYWTQQNGTPPWDVTSGQNGGDIWTAHRSSGGTWGPSAILQRATAWALNEPAMVLNGTANARVTFTEVTQDSTAESGALRLYVHGDGGYLAPGTVNSPTVQFDTRVGTADTVYTNSNLTATANATRTYHHARCNVNIGALDKKYWEFTVGTVTTAGDYGLGVATIDLLDTQYLGQGTRGVGYYADGGVYQNAVNLGSVGTYTTGDNVSIAYDRSANKIWFRKNGGNWNNDIIGNQNPATGTGGKTVNAYVYAAPTANFKTNGNGATAKFASASWTYTAPSGFSAITSP